MKRTINEYLQRIWGIKACVRIHQMSANAFKLQLRDTCGYERIDRAKWDWYQDSIATAKEWTRRKECNQQTYLTIPIKVVLPNLDDDMWRQKVLSGITSILGKPIGAQRLGKPNDKPSTMVEYK